jgi:DNA-binding MarR family transcriptional regulator
MLGVRRGTVSAAAAKFENAGLIKTHRGQIKLLDRDRLKKEACYCYEFLRKHIDRLVPK